MAARKNCWEFMKCGREEGGANAEEKGVCPAYPDSGHTCARVAGTLCTVCEEGVQGTHAQEIDNCLQCDFYKSSHYDSVYRTLKDQAVKKELKNTSLPF